MALKFELRIDESGCVKITDPKLSEELYNRGCIGELEGEELKLRPYEALFLVYNEKAYAVDGKGNLLGFKELLRELLKRDRRAWLKFLIYNDLRRRGFLAREAEGRLIKFAVIDRSKDPKIASYFIYVIPEGEGIEFKDLKEIVKECIRLRKEPIIAIIDKEGNISYYSLSFFKGL